MIGVEYTQTRYHVKVISVEDVGRHIYLYDANEQPICRLDVKINNKLIERDEFVLKNYAENSAIAAELLDKGILKHTGKYIYLSGRLCPICKINELYLQSS